MPSMEVIYLTCVQLTPDGMCLIPTLYAVPGISMEDFLEGVGVHFVDFTIEKGYGEMLHTLGRNFHAFLDNLDYLHW